MNHYFCSMMRNYILVFVFVLLSLYGCKKEDNPISGCMDPIALNYNENATENNNSCEYQYFVKLNFKLFDGTKELSRYTNFTNNNVNFQIERFKLYFSNIIINQNLTTDVFLFNIENDDNSLVVSSNNETLNNINFNIGLTTLQNQSDPNSFDSNHPLSISQNTYWFMTPPSYMYLMAEFKYDNNGDMNFTNPLTYHLAHSELLREINISPDFTLIKNDTIDLNLKILIPTALNNVDISENVPHSSNISPTSILIMDNISNAIIIEEI